MMKLFSLTYFELCVTPNKYPVFAVKHFQYWVEVFFIEVLLDSKVLDEINYY